MLLAKMLMLKWLDKMLTLMWMAKMLMLKWLNKMLMFMWLSTMLMLMLLTKMLMLIWLSEMLMIMWLDARRVETSYDAFCFSSALSGAKNHRPLLKDGQCSLPLMAVIKLRINTLLSDFGSKCSEKSRFKQYN